MRSHLEYRKLVRRSIGALAVVGMSLAAAACNRSAELKMPARPPAPVAVATAETRDVPIYLDEIGRVVPTETVSVVPQVGGKVISAYVEDGSFVSKGDPLFELDPRPFEATLASAEALLAQSRAERDLARIEFERMKGLASKANASQLEFDQKRIALEVAEAKILEQEAAVESARLNLEYTKILSPITGRAAARMVDPGNIVKANEATLQMIRRLDPIYVEFTVPENELMGVRRSIATSGQDAADAVDRNLRVEVDLPEDSTRILSALGGAAATTQTATMRRGSRAGRLTFLDNAVQGASGTVRLRATIDNGDHYLWPGQFVNVRLILTTKRDAVLVPAKSQQIGQQGPYVYVVRPDDTAELRPIVPGQRQGELMVVEDGVKGGERIVIAGQMAIMPNAKVMVTNSAPVPGAPAAASSATADARH